MGSYANKGVCHCKPLLNDTPLPCVSCLWLSHVKLVKTMLGRGGRAMIVCKDVRKSYPHEGLCLDGVTFDNCCVQCGIPYFQYP